MNEGLGTVFSFEGYVLDLRRGCLRRDAREVELRPKCFELLRYLVENAGRLVSKDELIDAVWPNVFVTEDSLTRCVSDIRHALGDDAQRIIRTLQRRGYLFAAPVTIGSSAPAQQPTPEIGTAKPKTNLPRPLAALIGREAELAELPGRVQGSRLVTLAGPSGIGKTRLAIELGWQILPHMPDGVWLIDLAPLTDPAAVTSAVAAVLNVALPGTEAPVETIAAAIAARRTLLIFDNCEHLIAAAADLIEKLLERATGLTILATSQELLRIAGEHVYRLNPLALPPPDTTDIAGFGAIILFVERARAGDQCFQLDGGNAIAVNEICRRLDGIPLALEMAASRLTLLGIAGLRARLDEPLRVLTTGPRTAETRHRTLRAMVAWSHDLLDQGDRRVFRRLAVFAGSFSLDAAVAVAGADVGDAWEIVDAVGRLVDKSLVAPDGGAERRYRLLEMLRVYAAEQLATSGELAAAAECHARFFADLFERAFERWEILPDAEWLQTYRPEIDNVRAALEWAHAGPDRATIAISLAGSAALFWEKLSLFPEGRFYLDRAARLVDRDTPPALAARLWRLIGVLWHSSDRLRAVAPLERSAAIYRQSGDGPNLGAVLGTLGLVYGLLGRHDAAKSTLCEARDLLATTDRRKSLFNVMNNLGIVGGLVNALGDAQAAFVSALDLARAQDDIAREIQVLANLAEVEFGLGEVDRAVVRGQEAVSRLRRVENRRHLGWALVNLASYLIAQDNASEARAIVEEALPLIRGEGGFIVRVCLQQWSLLYALEGRADRAARLIGFVDGAYALAGETRQPTEQQIHDRLIGQLRAALRDPEINACAGEGARWSEPEAVRYVLDELASQRSSKPLVR
jgi:predicted ATPase/DNA-binding winged helix-turn-helix (wHTH) protein